MIPEKHVKEYLEAVKKKNPLLAYSGLQKGDLVGKNINCAYEIDDPDIVLKIGNYINGEIPHKEIYKHFNFPLTESPIGKISKLSNEEGNRHPVNNMLVLPYSRIFNLGLGQCTELSIAGQLFAQRGRDAFLINGTLEDSEIGTTDNHAYMIVSKHGKLFIVDMANHLKVESNGRIVPYIAPIIGVIEEESEFVVPPEFRCGRAYLI